MRKRTAPLQIVQENNVWLGRLWSGSWDAFIIYCAADTMEEAIYEASVLGFSTEVISSFGD